MSAAVQLSFEASGLDPYELALIPLVSRISIYEDLHLSPEQREVAETAIRLVQRRRYGRAV